MPKKYKIGTRGSLLAKTQCTQVKDQLEQLTGDEFDLVTISTQGDENTQVPLWQLDGKDFFTKELDQALLSGEVDLVVHSYKDLGSERPNGIQLAAITKRQFPEDILLFKKELFSSELPGPKELIIGTSSPRRITNLTKYASEFFPTVEKIKTETLRGNVNTRIQKLLDGNYHAICLALAGLERLALSEDSLKVLKELTQGLSFMVLPPSVFPPAASQGSLGIECATQRTDSGDLLKKLKKIHDTDTQLEVSREREAFNSYGGGCHLAVGIHVKKWQDHFIHIHKGELDGQVISKQWVETLQDNDQAFKKQKELLAILGSLSLDKLFVGTSNDQSPPYLTDQLISKTPLKLTDEGEQALNHPAILYVTSKHCLPLLHEILEKKASNIRGILASGTQTMKKLIERNIPVQFCADSLGNEEIKRLINSRLVQTLLGEDHLPEILVLTNDQSSSTLGKTLKAYTRTINHQNANGLKTEIESKDFFYWTSFYQYEQYVELFPKILKKKHLCGLGKTFKEFSKRDIETFPIELKQLLDHFN